MTTQSITSVAITDGQKKQYKRFVEDAAERALKDAALDKDGLQRVIENGDDLQMVIVTKLKELSVPNKYADEEVESSYTYPSEYRGPKPIREQVDLLAKEFNLSLGETIEFIEKVLPTLTLPEGAEGWFAIPSVDAVAAQFFPDVTDPADKYCRAVQLVLEKIGKSRRFYNYRENQITPAQLRVHARTAHALDLIAETQKGDILIVAAQLGMRHRGRSARRAREVFVANEFGLGAFAVACMLLLHPEREVQWEQLHIDCAGDEVASVAVGDFSLAPFFLCDGGVGFHAYWYGSAGGHYGSVSGFLPQ